MSYIKSCNKCGARISMRQMSHGQWVAFDVGSDESHQCGVVGKKSNRSYVKKKASKFASINQKLGDMQIIDRFGEVYDLTPRNLKKLFNVLVKNQRQAQILYRDRSGDSTNRKIYPLGLIQNNNYGKDTSNTLKIVGYCNLRKDYRTFSLDNVEEIQALNKIPKTFRDKFNSLSSGERNKILEGTNFYGSNSKYFESDSTNVVKSKTKQKKEPRVLSQPNTTTNHQNYYEPENEDSGSWVWWVIGFFVLIWII